MLSVQQQNTADSKRSQNSNETRTVKTCLKAILKLFNKKAGKLPNLSKWKILSEKGGSRQSQSCQKLVNNLIQICSYPTRPLDFLRRSENRSWKFSSEILPSYCSEAWPKPFCMREKMRLTTTHREFRVYVRLGFVDFFILSSFSYTYFLFTFASFSDSDRITRFISIERRLEEIF